MRNPLITKKTSTPTQPPPKDLNPTWKKRTLRTAIARRPSISGRYLRFPASRRRGASMDCMATAKLPYSPRHSSSKVRANKRSLFRKPCFCPLKTLRTAAGLNKSELSKTSLKNASQAPPRSQEASGMENPCFRCLIKLGRQHACRQFLEQHLTGGHGPLEVGGYFAESEFNEPVIEQRCPYLEGVEHARPVHLDQDVFRKIILEVHSSRPIKWIRRSGYALLPDSLCGHDPMVLPGHQASAPVTVEERRDQGNPSSKSLSSACSQLRPRKPSGRQILPAIANMRRTLRGTAPNFARIHRMRL